MNEIAHYLSDGLELIPAVLGYPIINQEVLLGERREASNNFGIGKVTGIGGKIEITNGTPTETAEQCLVREFKEEVDITPTKYTRLGRVRYIFPSKPKWSMDVAIFTIQDWDGVPAAIEKIIPLWFPVNKLPKQRMWEDNLITLPRIFNGETFDLIFLYSEDEQMLQYLEAKTNLLTEIRSSN